MNGVLADASLPNVVEVFQPLTVTLFNDANSLARHLPLHDILVCRSTLKVTAELLQNTPIKLVATASSGSEHLDKNWMTANNIHCISAPGCNAHAVADYVCMVLAWLKTNKNWWGKTAGVIGCGHAGTQVKRRLESLGFTVLCSDPKRRMEPDFIHTPLEQLQDCDVLSIHCDHHHQPPYPSHHLLNDAFLSQCNPNAIIINAARGNIVDETALLLSNHRSRYCTDVYANEPTPNPELIKHCLLATPHIAGHTIEAKNNAVIMIAREILKHLNIPADHLRWDQRYSDQWIDPQHPQWANTVLSCYNPHTDSVLLKTAADSAKMFIQQRHAHNFRHNLNWHFR